jgi:hypothetical protein
VLFLGLLLQSKSVPVPESEVRERAREEAADEALSEDGEIMSDNVPSPPTDEVVNGSAKDPAPEEPIDYEIPYQRPLVSFFSPCSVFVLRT